MARRNRDNIHKKSHHRICHTMSTRQIGGLTALRFFAAFAILFHHVKGNFFPPDFMRGLPLDAGVTFFFVLSGFILSHRYSETGISGGLPRFYVARFARLWPAHVFCLLVLLVCIPWQRELLQMGNNTYIFVLNLLMLHSAVPIPDVYFSFNAVSWSISTEIYFYMAFPFLLIWFKTQPVIKLCCAIMVGVLLGYSLDASNVLYYAADKLDKVSSHGFVYISPLARIQEFMLGIVCQQLLSKLQLGSVKKVSATALEMTALLAILLLTPLLGFYSAKIAGPSNIALSEVYRHTSMAILFAAVISCFYMDKGLISKALAWRPLVFLGEISFSLYLIHQVIIRFVMQDQLLVGYPSYTGFLIVVAASIASAAFIWHFVEKPSQKSILRLYDYLILKLDRRSTDPA